jgi:hypothetical protein
MMSMRVPCTVPVLVDWTLPFRSSRLLKID